MKGLTITENPMGFTAIRWHYSADPDKDPTHPDPERAARAQTWLDTQRRATPDPNDFEREYEINFDTGYGARVFPQFTATLHHRPAELNRRKRIIRGWDFGWHAPACILAQTDAQDRLIVLKEILGGKQTTRDFAQSVIQKCAQWWPFHAAGYEDFCDPAGQQVKSIESEKSERRDIEVLQGVGIHPAYAYGWSRKDARSLIHQLLVVRNDGTPGLYVNETGCPLLSQAFLGRYIFPTTQAGKQSDQPNDDEHPWSDLMAALRYLVIGAQMRLGLQRLGARSSIPVPCPPPAYHGYGTPR